MTFKNRVIHKFLAIFSMPTLFWIALGFFIAYLMLFVYSAFLSVQVMPFPVYIPFMDPIGEDLRAVINFSYNLFFENQSPYDKIHPYPPLTNLLAYPLIFIELSTLYKIITLITISCFVINILIFSSKLVDEKTPAILILVLTTGLLSFGLQFELERGQFNVIAIFLCFMALWLFHYKSKYWLLAYVLLTLSIQLKVWPLIFVVLFVRDWKDWKNNLKRFAVIGAVNFGLLSVLGRDIFADYIGALTRHAAGPYYEAKYNHSIKSFLLDSQKTQGRIAVFIENNFDFLFWALLGITLLCIFYLIFHAYRHNQRALNPQLLLGCTLGALIITPTSHDYTLSTLAGPIALILLSENFWLGFGSLRLKIPATLMLLIFSSAYASTLFSYSYKPSVFGNILKNNFIPLMVMLIILTILQVMHGVEEKHKIKSEETGEIQTISFTEPRI